MDNAHYRCVRRNRAQKFHDLKLLPYIEVGCRLIQHQIFRFLRERPCNHHSLEFAAGELVYLSVLKLKDVGALHGVEDDFVVLFGIGGEVAVIGSAPEHHVVVDGEGEGRIDGLLHDRTEFSEFRGVHAVGRPAVVTDTSGMGTVESRDHLEDGCLAAAVGTDNACHAVVAAGEAHVLQDGILL